MGRVRGVQNVEVPDRMLQAKQPLIVSNVFVQTPIDELSGILPERVKAFAGPMQLRHADPDARNIKERPICPNGAKIEFLGKRLIAHHFPRVEKPTPNDGNLDSAIHILSCDAALEVSRHTHIVRFIRRE